MAGGGGLPDKYNRPAAFVFTFNLIIGAGALALPVAFYDAGIVLAAAFLAVIASVAWLCATYMVEAMSVGNVLEGRLLEAAARQAAAERGQRGALQAGGAAAAGLGLGLGLSRGSDGGTGAAAYAAYGAFEDEESDAEAEAERQLRLDGTAAAAAAAAADTAEGSASDPGSPRAPQPRARLNKSVSFAGKAAAVEEEREERQLRERRAAAAAAEAEAGERTLLVRMPSMADESLALHTDIVHRLEMGVLAQRIIGRWGEVIFYIVLIVYLFGDLSIYCVAVPASLLAVTGPLHLPGTVLALSSTATYYCYWLLFAVCLVPISFFNFQKTKWLQLATMLMRAAAFALMIVLPLIHVLFFERHVYIPAASDWVQPLSLPSLYGTAIYSFMCHHSLPSIITPVDRKRHLFTVLALDFVSIYVIYIVMSVVAVAAFGDSVNATCSGTSTSTCQIQELYTMNFASYTVRPIGWYIGLFPVFTLSTNFPLIAITLRNNLMNLVPIGRSWRYPFFRRMLFALVACGPPLLIAAVTEDVDALVSITGGIGGLGIMFFFPTVLVLVGRHKHQLPARESNFRSPMGTWPWLFLVLAFSCCCLAGTLLSQFYRLYGLWPAVVAFVTGPEASKLGWHVYS